MPVKTSSADLRESLRTAYLIAFDNFATDAKEIAAALGTDTKHANAVLQALLNKNLLAEPDHVNGEKKLTWQCAETYDSISRTTAIRRFDKAFPKGDAIGGVIPVSNGRKGATGPRYTPEQIKKGLAAKKAGKNNREVAEAAGVKSPAYFSKVLKAAAKEAEKAAKKGARRTAEAVQAGSKPKRVVRRSTKSAA
jgi:hypothetical protein